jgi:hypothetical protein
MQELPHATYTLAFKPSFFVGAQLEQGFQVARDGYTSGDGANDRGKGIDTAEALLQFFDLIAQRFYVDEHNA